MPPVRRTTKSNKDTLKCSPYPARSPPSSSPPSSSSSSSRAASSSSSTSTVRSDSLLPSEHPEELDVLRSTLQETERKVIILKDQFITKEGEYIELCKENERLNTQLKMYSDIPTGANGEGSDTGSFAELIKTIEKKDKEIRRLKMDHIGCDIARCNSLLRRDGYIKVEDEENKVLTLEITATSPADSIKSDDTPSNTNEFLLSHRDLLIELKSLKEQNTQLNSQLRESDEDSLNQISINISYQDEIDRLLTFKREHEALKVKYEDLQKRDTGYGLEVGNKMKVDLVFANNKVTGLNRRLAELEEEKRKLIDTVNNFKITQSHSGDEREGSSDSAKNDIKPSIKPNCNLPKQVNIKRERASGTSAASRSSLTSENSDRKGKKRSSERSGGANEKKRSKSSSRKEQVKEEEMI